MRILKCLSAAILLVTTFLKGIPDLSFKHRLMLKSRLATFKK